MTTIILIISLILGLITPAGAGTTTSNGFLYKPPYGAKGTTEYNTFNAGLDLVDTRLGKEIWVGDPNYGATLQTALTAIGASQVILHVPAGTHPIAADLTVPANVALQVERGATLAIATTKTLTINGPFTADLSQHFSCTGTGKVVFGSSPIDARGEWWGNTDVAMQSAINAMPAAGGTVTFSTPYTLAVRPDLSAATNVKLFYLPGFVPSDSSKLPAWAGDTYTTTNSVIDLSGSGLAIEGHAAFGMYQAGVDSDGTPKVINAFDQFRQTSGNQVSIYGGARVFPTDNRTGTTQGIFGEILVPGYVNKSVTEIVGGQFHAGTVETNQNGGGAINTVKGIVSNIVTDTGNTSTINYAYTGFFGSIHNGATISHYYGNYIGNPIGTGSITDAYGLYIEPILNFTAQGYSLYVAGGTSKLLGSVIIQTQKEIITSLTSTSNHVATDRSLGKIFRITALQENTQIDNPTNPVVGEEIIYEIVQDGTGGHTVTWGTAFIKSWSDTGNTLNKRSTIHFYYNADGNWIQIGAQCPYL